MALQLIRSDSPRRGPRPAGLPNPVARRRRRRLYRLMQAIQYGLSIPGTETGRQAKLLADIFGPQLGLQLDEPPQEPLTLRVLYDVDHDTARA
jgi:hypothetical protein